MKAIAISTVAAGIAPGTALSTTPPLALWNPQDSDIEPWLAMATLGYISGTLGAGTIVMALVPQVTVPSGGTELTCTPTGLPLSRAGAIRAFSGSTLSSTPALLMGTGWILGASLATTAALPERLTFLPPSETIKIPAGYALCLQGIAAAGTAPLVLFGALLVEAARP